MIFMANSIIFLQEWKKERHQHNYTLIKSERQILWLKEQIISYLKLLFLFLFPMSASSTASPSWLWPQPRLYSTTWLYRKNFCLADHCFCIDQYYNPPFNKILAQLVCDRSQHSELSLNSRLMYLWAWKRPSGRPRNDKWRHILHVIDLTMEFFMSWSYI